MYSLLNAKSIIYIIYCGPDNVAGAGEGKTVK